MKENEVSFEFEGVYHNAEVYINDRKAGFRAYGYTNFYVEADPYLKYGEENVIRVIAHNADQPNSRWYSGAGIYRPVWMDVFSKQHIQRNGIRIRTVSAEPPVIEVEVQTTAAGELELEVLETGVTANVETNGHACVQMEIPGGKLWNVDMPNLYQLKVRYTGRKESGADDQTVIRKRP